MAQVLKYRWDPETDQPVPYYEDEAVGIPSVEELAAQRAKQDERRTQQAMQPGMDLMRRGAELYADSAINYPLGLAYTLGGGLDAGVGWLASKAANSPYNPFAETDTDRNKFQRELKQFYDIAGLAAGFDMTPPIVAAGRSLERAPLAAMDASESAAQGMTLYHASPFEFNKFDPSKIGSGMGVNMKGRGFYLTDTEPSMNRWGESIPHGTKFNRYEVGVNSNPENFLDFEKKIGEQPESLRQSMQILAERLGYVPESKIAETALENREISEMLGIPVDNVRAFNEATIADIFAKEDVSGATNQKFLRDFDAMLKEAGIHGIKYSDATGATNYVVRDPDLMTIKRRYSDGGAI